MTNRAFKGHEVNFSHLKDNVASLVRTTLRGRESAEFKYIYSFWSSLPSSGRYVYVLFAVSHLGAHSKYFIDINLTILVCCK